MMKENTSEICALDKRLPRYYKGHDMDLLLHKMINRKPLTPEKENGMNIRERIQGCI